MDITSTDLLTAARRSCGSSRPHTLLGIWAHPDDESYLSAGLMDRVVRSGGRVTVVTATDGAAGEDADGAAGSGDLGTHRNAELRRALEVVGADEPELLGVQDGGCAAMATSAMAGRVLGILQRVQPDVVVTFGSDGFTGHADHRAVSRWVTSAWILHRRLGGDSDLLHPAITADYLRRHEDWNDRIRLFADHGPGGPPVTRNHDVVLAVRLDDVELDRKRAALAAHASQTHDLAQRMGEDTFRRWIDTESFRVPTPAELVAARTWLHLPGRSAGAGSPGSPGRTDGPGRSRPLPVTGTAS